MAAKRARIISGAVTSGFGNSLGFKLVALEPGHAVLTLKVTPKLYNPVNVLHGGVIYSLIDESMGHALTASLPTDQICATIGVKVNYLLPVRDGELRVETKILKQGKRVAHLESEVFHSPSGDQVATAMGSFSIFTPSGQLDNNVPDVL